MLKGGRRTLLEFLQGSPLLSIALVGLIGLLAVIVGTSFWQAEQAKIQNAYVQQTLTVRTRLKDFAIALRDAETGQRGFILTGDREYLAPYEAAMRSIPPLEDELYRLTADAAQQREQLARLSALVQRKLVELATTIQMRTDLGEEAAKRVVQQDVGQQLMVAITTTLDAMLAHEGRLVEDRMAAADRARIAAERLGIVGTVAATLFLLTAGLILRRTLKRLRESEAGFRLLAENASDMVARVGANAQLQYLSPAAERVLGIPADQLIEGGFMALVNAEDRPALDASMERLFLGTVENDQEQTAFRLRRADGTEVWIDATSRLLRDPVTAAPDGFIAVMHDITARQHAEAQLRESEARYRLLADSTSDMITWLNLRFERTYVSPAARTMLGYEPEELLGGTPQQLMHPDDRPVVEQQMQVLVTGAISRIQSTYRMRHKRGHWIWSETRFNLVRDPATGMAQSIVASLRDVSERIANTELERLARHLARARNQAEQASRAKSRFLASMSHELRTPLNGILGYAQVLRMDGGLNPAQEGQVRAMLDAGQHLLGMINRVLDFSEIETKKVALETQDIDPREIVRASLEIVRPMADAKHLELRAETTPDVPPRAVTDPGRLRQVLVNLLGNAVKFTAHGSVTLRLIRASHGGLRFEVADTGPGVSIERQHRLFHDFERLDSNAVEGAGLGLAISAGIVDAMRGQIGYADNPGGGSLFWLELPLATRAADLVPPPAPAAALAPPAPPARAARRRVLVADDVAMNRDIAGAFLRGGGHEVVFAPGGAEAVEAATNEDFDAILMDVRMPDVDGLEATRRIRALPGPRSRVPIVAVTAQTFAEQVRECRRAGMDDHLAKPFTQAALLALIARIADEPGRVVWHDRPAEAPSGPPPPATAEREPRPAPDPAPTTEAEPPVFDRAAFESTASFLEPGALTTFIQTLARQGESLLSALRDPESLVNAAKDLAAAAHRFAGSSEMFGFQRVGVAARAFERAVQERSPDLAAAIERLSGELEAFFAESLRLQPDLPAAAPRDDAGEPASDPAPSTAGPSTAAPDPSVFDRATFETTASFLEPEAVATYLETLTRQGEALHGKLQDRGALADAARELAGEAHRFAGSAEMFGFGGAGAAARAFERAAQTGPSELPAAADDFDAALNRFLAEIRRLYYDLVTKPDNVENPANTVQSLPVTAGS